jgi:hypothetical protein
VRWLQRKYRRLRTSKKALACWQRITNRQPRLFAHWAWAFTFTWATDHEGELSRLGVRAAPSALGLHATAVAPDQAAGLLPVPVRASAASPLDEEGETSRYPGVSVLSPSGDKPRTRRWAGSPRTAGVVLVAFAALGLSIAKAITYLLLRPGK